MHSCSECGSEYTSSWAAAQCEDDDRAEDMNTRQWFSNFDPHRKD